MSPTIEQVVNQARGLMAAGLGNELDRLATSYTPGDPTISIRNDRRIGESAAMSVGLTTLVAATSVTGKEVSVVPGTDGSPDESQPANTVVHLRPRHTTWQVFNEVAATVSEVSSARHGLHGVASENLPVDTTWNTYVLTGIPLRLLRVRYLYPGSPDRWVDVPWTFQPGAPDGATVKAPGIPGGTTVQFQYATQFTVPTSLDDTLASLGIPDSFVRLLAVGAGRNLSLASESRRSQPFSQGDPRRAEEVPITGNAMVYDRLSRQFKDLVADELARLLQQYPYRFKMEQYGMGAY